MSGRARKRFLLLLATAITLCLPLFGADDSYTIGIFPLQDMASTFPLFVQQTGEKYANTYCILNEKQMLFHLNAENMRLTYEQNEKLRVAYADKSFTTVEKIAQEPITKIETYPSSLPISYRKIPHDEKLATLLSSGKEAIEWYCSKENLDALLLLEATDLSKITRIEVLWFDLFSNEVVSIFDRISIDQNFAELEEPLGLALLSKTAGDVSVIVFDNPVPTLEVKEEGTVVPLDSYLVFLPEGTHLLQLGGVGYLSRSISLDLKKNTITHIDAQLEQEVFDEIKLNSTLGNVDWYINGSFREHSTNLDLKNYALPLIVVAQKEGFSNKTIQTSQTIEYLSFEMKPEWMDDNQLLLDAQKGFYKSLRNTILMFGAYVAIATLANTYEVESPLWQPLLVATSGISLVASLQTIMNLATYTSYAGSGVR